MGANSPNKEEVKETITLTNLSPQGVAFKVISSNGIVKFKGDKYFQSGRV